MRRLPVRGVLLALPLLGPCMAMSCGRAADVEVRGNLGDSVTFRFFEAGDDTEAIYAEDVRIVVAESGGFPVWQLEGQGVVPELTYGKPPAGFEETLEARPLQPGRRYSVQVEGWARFDLYMEGTCVFRVDESGQIVPEPGC